MAFLLTAYAVAWAVQLAAVKLGLPPRYASSVSVFLGLALPALLVIAATGGSPAPCETWCGGGCAGGWASAGTRWRCSACS